MLLSRVPFWALWLIVAVFTVTVTLANNTIFNETHDGAYFLGMDMRGLSNGGVGYCGRGLDDIEDDEEYEMRRRELPVALPRPGAWLVYASDASPEQSSIAVPWRRAAQLSPLDRRFSPEHSLCNAHPTMFRRPCHAVIASFPFLFPIMQQMAYASHSVYATYVYYRWSLDCAVLGWADRRRERASARANAAAAATHASEGEATCGDE